MEKRNISIQLLRVSACLLVFLVHFGQRVGLSGFLRGFSDFGAHGVRLFFLISGFLAGKTFYENPNTDILNYYKKRMIATLPLYYLVILYYFISENILNHFVSVIPADELGIGWFRYIFLLNGFLKSDTYFWSNLGITWTIPIFMFFYLVAPWILRKVRTVFASVVVWVIVFLATQILGVFYSCTLLDQLHFLFLGAMVYVCVKKECASRCLVVFLVAAICMTIIGKMPYAYALIFASILIAMTNFDTICLPKWMYNIVNVLDKYSYTIYLIHGVVFCSILDRLNALDASKIIIAIIAIVGTLAATVFVGKFMEKPIQSFLKKRFLNSQSKPE